MTVQCRVHFFVTIIVFSLSMFTGCITVSREGADGSRTQWQHPQLSQLYRSLVNRFQYSSFPSPAYLVALRLRCVQKTIQCECATI